MINYIKKIIKVNSQIYFILKAPLIWIGGFLNSPLLWTNCRLNAFLLI